MLVECAPAVELRLGLMLALLELKRLPARPPTSLAEIMVELPNAGDEGAGDAGVAMSVGVTSFRVMMATVVRVRDARLRLVLWDLLVGLNKLGRMTGVNVRLALPPDPPLLDEPVIVLLGKLLDPVEGSMLGESTNSVSRSSKLMIELDANVGVSDVGEGLPDEASTSPDSNSGVCVAFMSFGNALVEVGTISLFSFRVLVNSMDASEVGNRLICSVSDAGRISVLVSSWLVTMVLSPSIEVVQ